MLMLPKAVVLTPGTVCGAGEGVVALATPDMPDIRKRTVPRITPTIMRRGRHGKRVRVEEAAIALPRSRAAALPWGMSLGEKAAASSSVLATRRTRKERPAR